ncbi:hypothetical protein ACFXQA_09525 [Microbacterium sp. P07]|uniref:hypothetical protein n=1 Tax=Microbacterium sp. P07 TaxID=3366952 RepID=UPI003744EB37
MTAIDLSRRVAHPTALDRALRASAAAINEFVSARQRRRIGRADVHEYRRAVAEAQRDRAGAIALQMLPR